jgi:hypothetical protein
VAFAEASAFVMIDGRSRCETCHAVAVGACK